MTDKVLAEYLPTWGYRRRTRKELVNAAEARWPGEQMTIGLAALMAERGMLTDADLLELYRLGENWTMIEEAYI